MKQNKDKNNTNDSNVPEKVDSNKEKDSTTSFPSRSDRHKKPWWLKILDWLKSHLFRSGSSDIPAPFRYSAGFLFLLTHLTRLSGAWVDVLRQMVVLGEAAIRFAIVGIQLVFMIYLCLATGSLDATNGLAEAFRELRSLLEYLLTGK